MPLSSLSRWTAVALLGVGLLGCGPGRELTRTREIAAEQARELDALRQDHRQLQSEVAVLQDSLEFLVGIESGQYWRDQRALESRIEQLSYQLALARDGGRALATFYADELFEPASATLSARGRSQLDELAARIEEEPEAARFRVAGHSDSVPVGPSLQAKYPSNWELSAARASAVVRYLTEQYAVAPERFEVVAFAATRPEATNATPEGRRRNRRIHVWVSTPETP